MEPEPTPAAPDLPPEEEPPPDPQPAEAAPPEPARPFGKTDRIYLALVLAGLCLLSALLSAQGLARVERFGYGSPDDAMYVQALWNTSQGQPLRYSLEQWREPWEACYFGSHFDLTILLNLPLFWVAPGYTAVMVLHPLLTLIGALPLFFLARRRLASPGRAALVAGLYLLYPLLAYNSIRLAAYYWLTPPLILLALERMDAGRLRAAALAFGLAFMTREEVPLSVAALLLPLAYLDKDRRRFCLIVSGCGLVWTFLYLGLLKATVFGGGGGALWKFGHLGDSIPAILVSPLARPRVFFSHLLASESTVLLLLLALPLGPALLLAPRHLLAACVPWSIVAISSFPSDKVLGHYLVPAVPYLFAALVVGLERLRARRARLGWDPSLSALAIAGFLTLAAWQSDMGLLRRYQRVRSLNRGHIRLLEAITPEHAQVRELIATIPADASVSASPTTLLFLAKRRYLYPFPIRAGAVDCLLVDTRTQSMLAPRWPDRGPEAHTRAIRRVVNEPGVQVTAVGRFLLIDRRGLNRGE